MQEPWQTIHTAHAAMAPHRHREAYVALVLDGSYAESSLDGRFDCRAGTLVVHPAWHAHADEFGANGAVVLNLPVTAVDGFLAAEVPDPASIERLARRDPAAAGLAALEEAAPLHPLAPAAWLVRFVATLGDDDTDISRIARQCGVTPEHASRACKRWFGTGPAALRREGRLRAAMRLLAAGARPADAAAAAGFSDQPHLTRLLKRATGFTPATFTGA